MNRYKLIKILTLVLAIQFHLDLNAQGNTTLVEGHHLAGINVTSGKSGTIPLKYTVFIPGVGHHNSIPGHNASYNEGDAVIDGIMSEAALAIDWWVLFGEPAEQYLFTWKARDYYQIVLPDSGGGTRVHPINKSMLNKYPDLLVRFEALKPTEIEFEIEWTLGDTDFYYATERTFGSTYGTRNKFKTKVLSSNILIETSGKTPFSVPGIRQGKGEEFLGLDKDFPKDKLKLIMQQFATSKSHNILDVKVTKIKWPVGEMKAIAELYEKYEKGEVDPSPIQEIAKAEEQNKNLSTYNNNDFWGEAFEEEILNISIESKGSVKIIKNNNLPTFKTDQYHLEMFSKNAHYNDPNKDSEFLIMWSGNYNMFKKKYKHHIFASPYYLIDFRGNIISIDGKNQFNYISKFKNEQGFYEVVYFTDEWTYVRDICYTAGSGGIKLSKIAINNSFDEAKTKLLNHDDSESGCANGKGWSKYGVGKFIRYYLNDKMQVVNKKTEYSPIHVYNY
jgi:hypothetical protein